MTLQPRRTGTAVVFFQFVLAACGAHTDTSDSRQFHGGAPAGVTGASGGSEAERGASFDSGFDARDWPPCPAAPTRTIAGDVSLVTNADVEALAEVREVTGDLFVGRQVDILTTLCALQEVGGDLEISQNEGILHVDGLRSLQTIGESLRIEWNDRLENVDGFQSLETVGGSLALTGNQVLNNVDGLRSLRSVGTWLSIGANASLSSLRGLSSVETVGTFLQITNNAGTPTCEAEWLRDHIESIGSRVTVFGNDNKGVCD